MQIDTSSKQNLYVAFWVAVIGLVDAQDLLFQAQHGG